MHYNWLILGFKQRVCLGFSRPPPLSLPFDRTYIKAATRLRSKILLTVLLEGYTSSLLRSCRMRSIFLVI